MSGISGTTGDNELEYTIELSAPPERVFGALTSNEITDWWARPGVFDTREWSGELCVGGRWQAKGVSRGQPYLATGEFVEIDAPRKLVQTWDGVGGPGHQSRLTYLLEPTPHGTRLTLRQHGFASPVACREFAAGWETSFARLAQILSVNPAVVQA